MSVCPPPARFTGVPTHFAAIVFVRTYFVRTDCFWRTPRAASRIPDFPRETLRMPELRMMQSQEKALRHLRYVRQVTPLVQLPQALPAPAPARLQPYFSAWPDAVSHGRHASRRAFRAELLLVKGGGGQSGIGRSIPEVNRKNALGERTLWSANTGQQQRSKIQTRTNPAYSRCMDSSTATLPLLSTVMTLWMGA